MIKKKVRVPLDPEKHTTRELVEMGVLGKEHLKEVKGPICDDCKKEITQKERVAMCVTVKLCNNVAHRSCANRLCGDESLWVCVTCDEKGYGIDESMCVSILLLICARGELVSYLHHCTYISFFSSLIVIL